MRKFNLEAFLWYVSIQLTGMGATFAVLGILYHKDDARAFGFAAFCFGGALGMSLMAYSIIRDYLNKRGPDGQ